MIRAVLLSALVLGGGWIGPAHGDEYRYFAEPYRKGAAQRLGVSREQFRAADPALQERVLLIVSQYNANMFGYDNVPEIPGLVDYALSTTKDDAWVQTQLRRIQAETSKWADYQRTDPRGWNLAVGIPYDESGAALNPVLKRAIQGDPAARAVVDGLATNYLDRPIGRSVQAFLPLRTQLMERCQSSATDGCRRAYHILGSDSLKQAQAAMADEANWDRAATAFAESMWPVILAGGKVIGDTVSPMACWEVTRAGPCVTGSGESQMCTYEHCEPKNPPRDRR